jgi:hypothetical protein
MHLSITIDVTDSAPIISSFRLVMELNLSSWIAKAQGLISKRKSNISLMKGSPVARK